MRHLLTWGVPLLALISACSGKTKDPELDLGPAGAGNTPGAGGSAGHDPPNGSGGSTGSGTPDDPIIPPEESSLARGPACDFYPCFEACGQQIATAPIEPAFGFDSDRSIPWGVRGVTPLGSDKVLVLNMLDAEVRSSADMSLLGRVPVPGGYDAAIVGTHALARANGGSLSLLDLSSASEPRASSWWFDTGEEQPYLALIGALPAGFVLRTRGGVSLLSIDEAGQATELQCLPVAGYGSAVVVGDVLALTESADFETPTEAKLYRPAADGMHPIGSLPIDDELPFIAAGDRLGVLSNVRRTLTLYDVSGTTPEVVAKRDGLPQSGSGRLVSGGFAYFGDGDEEVALDLRGRLEIYDLEPVAESDCFTRLRAREGDAVVLVSPLLPGARLADGALPFDSCPVLQSYYDSSSGALSPDGQTLLFDSSYRDYSLIERDLANGEQQSFAEPLGGELYWIGDHILGAITEEHDYGIPVESRLELSSAAAPSTGLGSVPSPGPFISVRANATALWALSYAENYIFGEPRPARRVLWRLDPASAEPEPFVFDDVDVDDVTTLEVGPDRVYLITDDTLRVLDTDGKALSQIALTSPVTSSVASNNGLFLIDGTSTVSWLPYGPMALVPVVPDCVGCELRGAAGDYIYVVASAPFDAHHPEQRGLDQFISYSELRAYGLEGMLSARQPVPRPRGKLQTRGGNVVSISGTVVVLEHTP